MCPATLVIGGGIAGLTAALELADAAHRVYLVERTAALGGNLARVDLTAPHLDSARDLLTERFTRVSENPWITLMLNSSCRAWRLRAPLCAVVRTKGDGDTVQERKIDVGNVVVATGYKEFNADRITHYGHGKLLNVVTSFEFEQMLRKAHRDRDGDRRSTWRSSTASARGTRSSTATARGCAA
jgi:heterodisulfide reductase subunit A-like polyferredoxin